MSPVTTDPDAVTAADVYRARLAAGATYAALPRDRCNGSCETPPGCDCWPDTIPVRPAEAATEVGAEPRGRHRTPPLCRAWLAMCRFFG